MARSILSLVVVLLLIASTFITACPKTSSKANSQSNGLFCVGLVNPTMENITLTAEHSYGQDDVLIPFGNSSPSHIGTFTAKVKHSGAKKLEWNITFDFGTFNCLTTHDNDVKLRNINMDPENLIVCLEDTSPTVSHVMSLDIDLCSSATMNERINQRISTTVPPPISTEPSVAQDEVPTTSSFPAPAAALMVMVVLEVVATCVVGGVVVVLIQGVRTTKPATTKVQRSVSMRDLHICENDLYESFSGNATADQEGTTERDSQ